MLVVIIVVQIMVVEVVAAGISKANEVTNVQEELNSNNDDNKN
jgi:uncharacterized membrane protein